MLTPSHETAVLAPVQPPLPQGVPFASFELLWKALEEAVRQTVVDPRRAIWRACIEAALTASQAGACDALVSAALLHRVGDLLPVPRPARAAALGRAAHLGADRLEDLYPPLVTETIRLQPSSRRYLASAGRGGAAPAPMSEPERACFVKLPFAMNAVKLCRWILAAEREPGGHGRLEDGLASLRLVAARSVCNAGLGWGLQ